MNEKRIEGAYYCIDGIVVTQCSVCDIVNDSEGKQIEKLIKRISKRNKHPNTVKVTISLEVNDSEKWMEGMF